MKLNYKARLATLGKHQVDLIPVLRERLDMYAISPEAVSRALSAGALRGPKYSAIRSAVDDILDDWEGASRYEHNHNQAIKTEPCSQN